MANTCKPTHGFEIVLFTQVFEEYPPDLPPGHTYGNYQCLAGVPVSGITNNDLKEVELQLLANTSSLYALKAGQKYYAPVRIVKSPYENTYIGVYNPQCTTPLALSHDISVDFNNKLHSSGFGVVTSRKEKSVNLGTNVEVVLSCHICHYDWNPEARQQVPFEVTYIVRKKGTSNSFFGLFQIGREIAVSGPLIDWDEEEDQWVVLVNAISLSSVQSSLKPYISNTQRSSEQRDGIRGVVTKKLKVDDQSVKGKSKVLKASSSSVDQFITDDDDKDVDLNHQDSFNTCSTIKLEKDFNPKTKYLQLEEGEINEVCNNQEESFTNTFGKQKTHRLILSDARKRLRMVNEGLAANHPDKNNEKSINMRFSWEIPLNIGNCNDECNSCGALHWHKERNQAHKNKEKTDFSICCQHGSFKLPHDSLLSDKLDPFLQKMFFSNSKCGKQFRNQSRLYNNSLSFTSAGVKLDKEVQGHGTYCFRVKGQLFHNIGSIFPDKGQTAKFAQIFVVGDSGVGEVNHRIKNINAKISHDILLSWQKFLNANNPYAKIYRSAKFIIGDELTQTYALRSLEGQVLNPSSYNKPTANEIAMVITDGTGKQSPRDIVLHRMGGNLQHIQDSHSGYLALRYPLLFPYGEQHWHPNSKLLNTKRKVSQTEWYAYLLFDRINIISLPLHAKRLFQEFVVDLYICIESNRLQYIRSNQQQLKVDMYQGLTETLEAEGDVDGKKVILPSTFIGGPRAMLQLYQDAMALVKCYGKPSLFITMTANPKWPEIGSCLHEGEIPSDWPDIITRVFKMKFDILIRDLTINKRLGTVLSYVFTIEFQKRGLPHAHIILILAENSVPRTVTQIDALVCAEIPDPTEESRLFELVTSMMLHSPCKQGSRCWASYGCKYGFPKQFINETLIRDDAYPAYRRQEGHTYVNGQYTYTNRDVIPYNKYLTLRYECHINVEIPYGIKALKYLYKYICKGEDRSALNLELNDETVSFVNGRYIGPLEATWRLFQFNMSGRKPSIQRLSLHLENQQLIYFRDEEGAIKQIRTGAAERTTLTEFFCLNQLDAVGKGKKIRKLLYHEVPLHFYWDKSKKQWLGRVKSAGAIGRLFFAKINEGERYYLRLLLLHRRNLQSFAAARTYNGVCFPTFRQTAEALGLLLSDKNYKECLTEAGEFMSGSKLREMFAILLVHSPPSNPLCLLHQHMSTLSDDCKFRLQREFHMESPNPEDIEHYCLFLIQQELELLNTGLAQVGINLTLPDFGKFRQNNNNRSCGLGNEAKNYNVDTLAKDQAKIFDDFFQTILSGSQYLGFVDGPGGSGKTYLLNSILQECKKLNIQVDAVCASGIAALLILNGTTAHSAFSIPLTVHEDSICSWFPKDAQSRHLETTKIIIWDEISMQHRHAVEAVNRSLRDLRKCEKPFGGISVLFSGDFRQILPIVKHGGIYEQASFCIKRSYIWGMLTKKFLHENLRLRLAPHDGDSKLKRFGRWLCGLGEGLFQESDIGTVHTSSLNVIYNEDTQSLSQALISFVYSDLHNILNQGSLDQLGCYYEGRAIITPLNISVNNINATLLESIRICKFVSRSIDIIEGQSQNEVPEEILNAIHIPGFPMHLLELKEGTPVILLRNLNIARGLCNGTRLMIQRIRNHVLICIILTGFKRGQRVLIPKIKLFHQESEEYAISFSRYQFPVSLCFAMTINKAQGQSFDYVGVYLNTNVFSHGQLYVALSRTRNPKKLLVGVNGRSAGSEITSVVVRDIFS
ncbi:hypothetical protein O181_010977 [Austropuccinia psidii MF-1]|uniref:ATP-dependent DNA helicase n=1 Tax=Austropuccinia psidii MF-1 TaxID=1389203 RepID=A0A9Q3BTP4_9BASI|nr:hypothetical protein [Austropuccinia psidii MF-1]